MISIFDLMCQLILPLGQKLIYYEPSKPVLGKLSWDITLFPL